MSAPAVAVSLDGKRFAAAWMDKRQGKQELDVYWSLSASPGLGEDAPVQAETRGIQNHPALAVAPSGTVWAVWEDGPPGEPRIRARSLPGGAAIEVSAASEGAAEFPVVAAGAGLVAVVYEARKDGEPAVVFRLLEPATTEG